MKKICNKCKEEKDKILFPSKGAVCKQCGKEIYSIWREKNKEKLKNYYLE